MPRSARVRKLRNKLRERDGDNCFYCGLRMLFELPSYVRTTRWSATLEHLVDKSHGGRNTMGNCVLAHQFCNNMVCGFSLKEKFARRDHWIPKWAEKVKRGKVPSFYQMFKDLELERSQQENIEDTANGDLHREGITVGEPIQDYEFVPSKSSYNSL